MRVLVEELGAALRAIERHLALDHKDSVRLHRLSQPRQREQRIAQMVVYAAEKHDVEIALREDARHVVPGHVHGCINVSNDGGFSLVYPARGNLWGIAREARRWLSPARR